MNSKMGFASVLLLLIFHLMQIFPTSGYEIVDRVPPIHGYKIPDPNHDEIIKMLQNLTTIPLSFIQQDKYYQMFNNSARHGKQLYVVNRVVSYDDAMDIKSAMNGYQLKYNEFSTFDYHFQFVRLISSISMIVLIKSTHMVSINFTQSALDIISDVESVGSQLWEGFGWKYCSCFDFRIVWLTQTFIVIRISQI